MSQECGLGKVHGGIVMAQLVSDSEKEDEPEPGPSDMEIQGPQASGSLGLKGNIILGPSGIGHDQPDCRLPTYGKKRKERHCCCRLIISVTGCL